MKVLIDTNVVLDVLCKRCHGYGHQEQEHGEPAASDLVDDCKMKLHIYMYRCVFL